MNAILTRRSFLLAASAVAAIACNRRRSNDMEPAAERTADAAPSSSSPSALSPWEPLDEMFRGCEAGCGARVASASPGVVVQPGAQISQRTYCPVSGVVFTVTDASPREDVDGRAVYVCCAGCAKYFAMNRDRIIALRRLGS